MRSKRFKRHEEKGTYFSELDVWNILIQITQGLNQLHEMNIMHRDLKSANIFLYTTGEVKLGDLNVSKVMKNGLEYTQTGTPYYASPEVWKDQPYDTKSDIWSFGCVIYEIAALDLPFQATSMDELFKTVKKGVFNSIPDFYSIGLHKVISSMLQTNPENRPSWVQMLNSPLFK